MAANRAVVAILALAAASGCSRTFYRQQADADAYTLIDPKAQVAGAAPATYRIDIDPRSRMFDPNNPDVEPMPPDDPLSSRYMEVVDRKKGSKLWRELPRTAYVENADWQQFLPRNTRGEVQLDLRGAVELALLHSPDYQSELEELYLSALDVSFERFRFDTQFFGGSEVFLTAEGRDGPAGSQATKDAFPGNSSTVFEVSPLRPGNALQARRLTATGGELVVGAANSFVWQFAGPNDYTSTTLLDFSLLQPLLRGGGRTLVLERLTIAERSLLANVRQMEHYRRGFYLDIVSGQDLAQGPSRRGGFFGGSGLEGFSGVGGGGFGNVGNFGQFGGFFGGFGGQQGVGGGFTGGAGAQGAGGFMGLLQTKQQIRNQRSNVVALGDSYEQLQATYDAGRIDKFQVDLARQALYNAQSQLLTSEAGFQTVLDNFKMNLGLPPELPLAVDDPLLDRFNLLDPDLEAVEVRVRTTLGRLRELRQAVQDAEAQGAAIDPALNDELARLLAESLLLQEAVAPRLAAVRADLDAQDAAIPRRELILAELAQRTEVRAARLDARLFDPAELEARAAQRRADFQSLEGRIAGVWAQLAQLDENRGARPDQVLAPLTIALADLSGRLLELRLVQAAARLEAITFEPFDLTDEEALLIASVYRRDWQNARAALVDSWRLIYFNANALRSDLDIVFSGDISNLGDNPFRIRDTTGRLRAGVQFDAPLTRLSERNQYRQALIEYQQARRNYYQFRDGVSQSLRSRLRQMRLNELNFELRRAAVLVAISQVDLTQLRLAQPPQAGVTTTVSPTQARDLVQSLGDLLNVQNDFLSVWVNHEVQRLGLEFDLGVMELDSAGLRCDRDVPLSSFVEGAQRLRACLCNASDLYPGVGQVYQVSPPVGEAGGAPIEPLVQPDSLQPEMGEAMPLPPPLPLPPDGASPGIDIPQLQFSNPHSDFQSEAQPLGDAPRPPSP
jgi:outer membrane protein TolC